MAEEQTPEQNPPEPPKSEEKPAPATENGGSATPGGGEEKPPESEGDPKKILNELDKDSAEGGSASRGQPESSGEAPPEPPAISADSQAPELISDAMKRLDELLKKLKSCRKDS